MFRLQRRPWFSSSTTGQNLTVKRCFTLPSATCPQVSHRPAQEFSRSKIKRLLTMTGFRMFLSEGVFTTLFYFSFSGARCSSFGISRESQPQRALNPEAIRPHVCCCPCAGLSSVPGRARGTQSLVLSGEGHVGAGALVAEAESALAPSWTISGMCVCVSLLLQGFHSLHPVGASA